MTRPSVVFFDLGDTIWHHPHRPAPDVIEAELVRRLEAVLGAHDLHPRMGAREVQRALGARGEALEAKAVLEGDGDYQAMTLEVLREAGLNPSPEQVEAVWETRRLGGRFLQREILPGAYEMLATLRARGFRLGVITNRAHGGASFRAELADYQLDTYFDALICSDRVGYRKPHPRIFEVALEAFGIAPEQAVHVGDNLEADVHGARQVGILPVWMRGVQSPGGNPTEDVHSVSHVIHHLSELLSLPFLSAYPP
ncbi:MAG: HAD family hydrolase [Dehalococcoidia bacterium]|nr:HAD family hydrolase [Dehalococcoidia bacterium]